MTKPGFSPGKAASKIKCPVKLGYSRKPIPGKRSAGQPVSLIIFVKKLVARAK
ncbi:MAG: hypothetical protein GY803_06225 [Chloroflexi bacterium]|nr:hypothetical protein [Chloroflexota bacterium]